MSDGDRTHGHWSHNPALYQLSYTHHVHGRFRPQSLESSFGREELCQFSTIGIGVQLSAVGVQRLQQTGGSCRGVPPDGEAVKKLGIPEERRVRLRLCENLNGLQSFQWSCGGFIGRVPDTAESFHTSGSHKGSSEPRVSGRPTMGQKGELNSCWQSAKLRGLG